MEMDVSELKGALCPKLLNFCSIAASDLKSGSDIWSASSVLHTACRGLLTVRRGGKTAKNRPVGVNMMRSSVLYQAALLRLSMQACYNGAMSS